MDYLDVLTVIEIILGMLAITVLVVEHKNRD